MRTLTTLLLVAAGWLCQIPFAAAKDVVIKGKIKNKTKDSVIVMYYENTISYVKFRKAAYVTSRGEFRLEFPIQGDGYQPIEIHYDTLALEAIVSPATDMVFRSNTKNLEKRLKYRGKGSHVANFMNHRSQRQHLSVILNKLWGQSPDSFKTSLYKSYCLVEIAYLRRFHFWHPLPKSFREYWKKDCECYFQESLLAYPALHERRINRHYEKVPKANYSAIDSSLLSNFDSTLLPLVSYQLYLLHLVGIHRSLEYPDPTGVPKYTPDFFIEDVHTIYATMPSSIAKYLVARQLYIFKSHPEYAAAIRKIRKEYEEKFPDSPYTQYIGQSTFNW